MGKRGRLKTYSLSSALIFAFVNVLFAQAKPDSAVLRIPSIKDSVIKRIDTATTSTAVFDSIAGPLPDTVKVKKNFYLVVGDIIVPEGKTVTIEQGVALLFKGLTGLHIQGKLIARGAKDRPIILSSENDRGINPGTPLYPNPYDWNGIYFHGNAVGSSMSFCTVSYSVYGVASETKFIKLDSVTFRQNGESNCVIEGKSLGMTDAPFTYSSSSSSENKIKAKSIPVNSSRQQLSSKRSMWRYFSFLTMFGAVGVGAYEAIQWKNTQYNLTALSVRDPAVLRVHNENDWITLRQKRDNARLLTGGSVAMALIGGIGFALTFHY